MLKKISVCSASLALAMLLIACSAPAAAPPQASRTEILVSAAASLTDAFQEIKAEFEKDNPGIAVVYNFGSSGTLQLQIEQGAPSDVFASAGKAQMDALDQKGLLLAGSRRNFAGNTAVLIVPKTGAVDITGFADLVKPQVKNLAIGNPDGVPAGTYARQVLESAGLWAGVQGKIVMGGTVRQVLTYVEQGNAEAGIVYSTDAITSDEVKVIARAPAGSSDPIVYPIAAIARSKYPQEARAFVDFVAGPKGQAMLARYGFLPPP
ncbi:MAG: molybdate ABC transporter substrate-binding protein [Dehalococcoidia bacterium]|nr:molybdate ABC transporter substrate-binding protein [Dehalococcoidia bacterium]